MTMPQRSGGSGRFYLALAVATAATLALEIIQTRILSVVSWYHLAFFVISVAMFGMTVGALLVFLRPAWFPREKTPASLARFCAYAGIATLAGYLDQITLASEMVMSMASIVVFTHLALAVSLPFIFSGVAVALALTRSPFPIGRTYAADLVGAAIGCLAVIPLLDVLDGPGAVFVCGALFGVAALLFDEAGERVTRRLAVAVIGVMTVLAITSPMTLKGFDPIMVKGQAEKRHGVAYERWNSFSRVVAYKPWNEAPSMVMWAASPKVPTDPVDFVMMNIDGLAGTVIFKMTDGDPASIDYLKYDLPTIAHHLRKGKAAIIGVGGGRDLAAALAYGQSEVLGVELNPAFTEALNGPYREYAGLADNPNVRIETDEARSYFTRDRGQYDILMASLIDTWAATGAGAYSLSENSIYTVEAWQTFLARLAPRGIFTVSRWYAPDRLDETARLISLAAATLMRQGVTRPADHILLAAHKQVATILVSNDAFSSEDIERFGAVCDDLGFSVLLAPGQEPPNETLSTIINASSEDELVRFGRSTPLDLTPPTDSRPFFFNLLRMTRPWEVLDYIGKPSGVVTGNLIATVTLLAIIGVTLMLAAATIVLPAWLAPAGSARPGWAATTYFTLIGLGFMLSEIAFLQRFSVYLGHPVYSLAVVLFSIILFTGVGSFVGEKLRIDSAAKLRVLFVALPVYLAACAYFLPDLTHRFAALELFGRAGLCVAILAPAGLMMGQAFPGGMRLVAQATAGSANDPTPWLWGVNGAAGVAAGALAVAISIAFGINATLIAGAACYLAIGGIVGRVGTARA